MQNIILYYALIFIFDIIKGKLKISAHKNIPSDPFYIKILKIVIVKLEYTMVLTTH